MQRLSPCGRRWAPAGPRPARRAAGRGTGGWAASGLVPWIALGLVLGLSGTAHADELGSAVYVRNDTDKTTVISPHLRYAADIDESTRAEAAYTVDVWTSASIDVRTSATPRARVTEQRDEIDLSATHVRGDLSVTGAYRYSVENDYLSHGGVLSVAHDFAGRATTLAASMGVTLDEVGRAGYPQFSEDLTTFNTRLGLTQVLDPSTIMLFNYELILIGGYQSSPYRYVGVGGDGTSYCGPTSTLCVPERVPQERSRHALAAQGKRALGDRASLGLGYRYYFDSWELSSHTVDGELSWLASERAMLKLGLRYYTQGAVSFYKAAYQLSDNLAYRTRDRELSALSSLRVSALLERSFEWTAEGRALRVIATGAYTSYSYDDFPGYEDGVQAYELTVSLGSEL